MTLIGAFPVVFGKRVSPKVEDILLGFSAGVMLAASFFSLLNPSVELALSSYENRFLTAVIVAFGLSLGAFIFFLADRFIPEDYFVGIDNKNSKEIKSVWIFILAITVHNFPEGMSSAIGFMTGDISKGLTLAVGIGIQNIPEGLAVALTLVAKGYRVSRIFWVTFLSSIVEPIGGVVGVLVFGFSYVVLPIGLAFAAGAMIFVISKEIIPQTHKKGYEMEATIGLLIGFIVMMVLDVTFG
ncbi:MAG: ZIP family metal transporter [Aquificae bacterium]|nr:ZIP family metal transporter [Aquificota bacterium]